MSKSIQVIGNRKKIVIVPPKPDAMKHANAFITGGITVLSDSKKKCSSMCKVVTKGGTFTRHIPHSVLKELANNGVNVFVGDLT